MKEEVIGFFRDFHNHGCFTKSLNATFIFFDPKERRGRRLNGL